MHSQTIRYARNGALGAIFVYLLVALPLLGISMSEGPSIEQPVSASLLATAP